MSSLAHRARVMTALAVSVVALAAWPSVAAGALNATGAKLNGATSVSTPPGGVFNARVTTTVTSGTWRATQVEGGLQPACADHDNRTSTGTEDFNVTAPGEPGNYDAEFTASADDDCSPTSGATETLLDAVRVTTPAPNPNLPPRCGINVMLVLDESGSIASSNATESVRDATRAFLNALSGTGAAVSIIDFSSTAARPVPYTTVTSSAITTVFEPYLKNGYAPSGWTNWEAAFQKVREANTQGTLADLVVFVTDGDPTARNTASGDPVTGLVEGEAEALRRAAEQADLVKAQKSHVFALGVGQAVTKPTSARRLTAISGFDQYPETGFDKADYTLVEDFDDLAKALRAIALELCQASVTVTKMVDEGDGVFRPDPEWEFTATVSTSPGSYAWLQPAPPPETGARSKTTNKDGVATFQWKPQNATATSTVTLQEKPKAGYAFVDANCTTLAPTARRRVVRRRRVVPRGRSTNPSTVVTVGPNQYARCTVRNRINPGTIEIEKSANPQSSQVFAFSGSGVLGNFSLVDDGTDGSSSSRTFTGLAPGTYTVSELGADNWELTGVTCTPEAAAVATGAEVAITIGPGDSVVCTYRDARVDPPPDPEPPEPPGPPGPGPPTPPEPPEPPTTELDVVKTAARVARVGDRVQFSLSVTNTGSIEATNVRVADIPPAALTLTASRSTSRARMVRGNAIWRVARLAPGARYSVRGSVRVESGTPGLKRNLVLASAANAHLVSDRADTRILGRRRAPRVTG